MKKGFESFNRFNSLSSGYRWGYAPASLVGCGEARTASIEALGFNSGFGQQRDISQRFQ